MLDLDPANLAKMKNGQRHAGWRVLAGLRVIAGEDAPRAFMEELATELEQSESAGEKKAALGFRAALAAFANGGDEGIRTLDAAHHRILP